MASDKEYLAFVSEQLSGTESISFRPMMGEYILYCRGKVVGGIYDDRLLLKATPSAVRLLQGEDGSVCTDIPYPGAKAMLVADVDDRDLVCRAVQAVAEDLLA